MSILSTADAERYYDRFGSRQDDQGFYEAPALDILVGYGIFEAAQAVVEFGCGTSKFADCLLRDHLSPTARYWGFDLSATMVELAQASIWITILSILMNCCKTPSVNDSEELQIAMP